MAGLDSLQEALGITFKDRTCLQQALVHRSYLNETPDFPFDSNERLEFLGDALLGLIVAERLYWDFPSFQEGELTKLRSSMVRTETLARVARTLNIGDHLYLGKGEEDTGGRNKSRNLAGAIEAVIGAVLIDQGFDAAKKFVLRLLADEMESALDGDIENDPKSRLQELIQGERQLTPVYQTVDSAGPDHAKVFTVEVFAGDDLLGCGMGKSKKRAEQEAAKIALDKLEGEDSFV